MSTIAIPDCLVLWQHRSAAATTTTAATREEEKWHAHWQRVCGVCCAAAAAAAVRADQGESNANQYNAYAKQMRDLIAGWRRNWESPPALRVRRQAAPHGMACPAMAYQRCGTPPGTIHTRLRRQRDACLSAAIQQHDDTVCRCGAWQNFTFIEHQLSAYSGTQGAVSGLRWSQQVKIKPLIMIEPLCVQLPRHSGSIAV